MRVDGIELALWRRSVAPSKLHRNIVEPAPREATIEVAHPRNDHARDRNANVGARLVEHEEVKAGPPDGFDTGHHLLARIETIEGRGRRCNRRPGRRQIRMILQAERRGAVEAFLLSVATAHESNRQ